MKEKRIQKVDEGNLLTPKGFQAGGIHTGLRRSKLDFGILYSEQPASCAAVYTKSHFQAAPLKVTQESISHSNMVQALVINSAVANACTGEEGLQNAYQMRKWGAERLGIPTHYVAVASTGVIGEQLPMEHIQYGCSNITYSSNKEDAQAFQQSILTTDTLQKTSCYQVEVDGETVTLGGAAKGSGMVHPNMATMLGFITTDATIASDHLQNALRGAVDQSFNQITIDGETSTNDMVLTLANHTVEHETLQPEHPDWENFVMTLNSLCEDLAKQIARDGEGATKLVEVNVEGAWNEDEAQVLAKNIVSSDLVKTAVYGEDANWGRIVVALGHSEARVNPELTSIRIGSSLVFSHGVAHPFSEEEVAKVLHQDVVQINVSLQEGNGLGRAWGCDLTYDYVKINASYRT
nr:bifunctional ornithine acetyltransferase/N-acetylglutamate synthase [Thalassobacillus sp. CUG 92003]